MDFQEIIVFLPWDPACLLQPPDEVFEEAELDSYEVYAMADFHGRGRIATSAASCSPDRARPERVVLEAVAVVAIVNSRCFEARSLSRTNALAVRRLVGDAPETAEGWGRCRAALSCL